MINYRRYITYSSQKCYQIILIITFTISLVTIVNIIFPNHIYIHNFASTLIITIIFTYRSLIVYVQYKRKQVFLYDIELLKQQNDGISYAIELICIYQACINSVYIAQYSIIASLIQNHKFKCLDPICRCGQLQNYENKDIFIKQLISDELKKISEKIPYSFILKAIALSYLLQHSGKILNIYHELYRLQLMRQERQFQFDEQFILSGLFEKMRQQFIQNTRISKNIKCENIFLQQLVKNEVLINLNNILDLSIQKYNILLMQIYKLNIIQQYCLKINREINQIQKLWLKIKNINSYNFQIHQIFIYYYQFILISRIQAKAITQQIYSKLEKLRLIKGLSKQTVNRYMYSKKTCIIQSDLNQTIGTIHNITSNCDQVLGVQKQRLLNENINNFMPDYFAKDHEQGLINWVNNFESSQMRSQLIQFGYVDAKRICFQGYLFMKILINNEKILYYTMIIRQNDHDYLLLNQQYQIQGIGKRLLKDQIFHIYHIKQQITNYCDINFQRLNNNNNKIKTTIILQGLYNKFYPQDYPQINFYDGQYQKIKLKYQCNITLIKYSIYKTYYYLIKFQAIKKWFTSEQSLREMISFQNTKDDCKTIKTLTNMGQGILINQQYESFEPMTNHAKFTQICKIAIQPSSTSSSSNNETTIYNNFICKVKKYFINSSIIKLKYYNKITIFIIILCSLIGIQFFSLRQIFVSGFNSFNDVMFGDGAVSDNNQILQIMYNNILMSKIYCKDSLISDRCRYLLNSTAFVSNILYNLYLSDIQVYLTNKTALSHLKFYQSYDIKVPFVMGNTTINITTLQFMQYYYYAVKKQYDNIIQNNFEQQNFDAMQILYDNWSQMKFINHNAIYFYLNAGQYQLFLLLTYLLLLGIALIFSLIVLGVGLNRYNNYLYEKKVSILDTYQCISMQTIRNMIQYYENIKQSLSILKFKPYYIDNEQQHQTRKKAEYERNNQCLIQIIIILLIFIILGGVQILQISLTLPPCKNMVNVINHLMDSQNYLLQAYFQMKIFYLSYDFNKSIDQISKELSVYLNQNQPTFTRIASDSINLFASDPTFANDFNDLLILNVCDLTANLFQSWQVDYCHNNFTYTSLAFGLTNGMTFFQRNAFKALSQLHRRQFENINKTQYFKQDVFKDIDDSIFYMFRLYQATQARMYQGLNYMVTSSLVLLDFINSISLIILFIIIIWWFRNFEKQQIELGQLYGTVLQLPENVVRREIFRRIKQQLEIEY